MQKSAEAILVGGNEPDKTGEVSQTNEGLNGKCSRCAWDVNNVEGSFRVVFDQISHSLYHFIQCLKAVEEEMQASEE